MLLATLLAVTCLGAADVAVLDRLDRNDGAVVQKTLEGLKITAKTRTAGQVKLETTAEFKAPLVITAVAKTDSLNLRLFYGSKGMIIFNWELGPTEFRAHDPKTGQDGGVGGQGSVPPNTWVTVRWIIAEEPLQFDG